MRARLRRAVAVAVVLVAATLPALAQGVGLVSGRVTDERGVPLKGAVVTLSGPGVLGRMEAVTGEDGRYRFRAVPPNHPVTVTAAMPGWVPLAYVGHEARPDAVLQIDFTLRPLGQHEILVLVEDGVPYHTLALEGAVSTMPGHVSVMLLRETGPEAVRELRDRLDLRPSAVLAIGDMAARLARRYIRDVPVVYSMVPAPLDSDLTTANLCGVPLNGGFDAQLEQLKRVMPDARRIGTIYDPHRMGRCFRDAKRVTASAGMELIAAHVHGDDAREMAAALQDLGDRGIDAFMLLMDPQLMDADSFEQVARFARTHDVVMAVPDPSLIVSDRSFSFTPGFRDLGAYAGLLVRRIVEGKVQPSQIGITYPEAAPEGGARAAARPLGWREVLPGGDAGVGVDLARDE